MKNKEKIFFIIGIISMIVSSGITVYAASYLYNSSDVSYDNTTSKLSSDNVQGAIDELYCAANNYSEVNEALSNLQTKVANLESKTNGLNFDKTYGDYGNSINIDTINNHSGYIYRVITGSQFSGTSPISLLGGNAFLLMGFSDINQSSNLPNYGVQIAIGFGSSNIAIRNVSYNTTGATWGAWKKITP